MDLAISLILLLFTIGSGTYALINTEKGASIRSAIYSLAKDLNNAMNSNSNLKEKLTNAYQAKNSSLVNEIFKGAGFGSRAAAIRKEIAKLDREYINNQAALSDKNKKITEELNKLSEASAEASSGTIKGNKNAEELYADVRQNIDGGITTNAPETAGKKNFSLTMPSGPSVTGILR